MFYGARLAERVQLFRELATLVDSGMTIGMALSALEGRPWSLEQRLAVSDCARQTMQGKFFSQVMARHPKVFNELSQALVAAGERGGKLDSMLNRIADYLEQEQAFHQMLSRETFYPKILLLAVLFIPLGTQMIIAAISGSTGAALAVGLKGLLLYATVGGVPAVVLWQLHQRYMASESGRQVLDQMKLRIPLVGKVLLKSAWARLCRALGALYDAGVPLSEAVPLAARTAQNRAIERLLSATAPKLQQGIPLSEALATTGQVPPLAMSMLQTGEQTGQIDATLGKVADYYEAESYTATRQMTLAIVPVAVIIFGIVVLMQLVGFYGGYFGGMMGE